jgi:hypothetical protein
VRHCSGLFKAAFGRRGHGDIPEQPGGRPDRVVVPGRHPFQQHSRAPQQRQGVTDPPGLAGHQPPGRAAARAVRARPGRRPATRARRPAAACPARPDGRPERPAPPGPARCGPGRSGCRPAQWPKPGGGRAGRTPVHPVRTAAAPGSTGGLRRARRRWRRPGVLRRSPPSAPIPARNAALVPSGSSTRSTALAVAAASRVSSGWATSIRSASRSTTATMRSPSRSSSRRGSGKPALATNSLPAP